MTAARFMDDPNWASFIPEMKEAARQRHLPTHEDCECLDIEKAAEHLRRGGTLGSMNGYEERPGQIDMLRAIAVAFNGGRHLMVEAGTGIGKSLAYLVPSILWAWTNDTPVVISTATRNLQSQLVGADIPKALAILGPSAADFKVALLKGRTNYLCLRAVDEYFSSGFWTLPAEEQELVAGFIEWLKKTPDGDLDLYDGLPRNLLSCPGDECGGRRCPFYDRCFVYKARKRAAAAHIVIVNHALVLAEATAPGSGILPGYGRLIIDEAHNLEDIATDYLSKEFSLPSLARILNRLMRRGRGKRMRPSGTFAAIERQLQKGVLAGSPAAESVKRLLIDAPRHLVSATNAAEDLAETAALLLKPAKKRDICRYRVVNGVRQHSLNRMFEPYADDEWDEESLKSSQAKFEVEIAGLVNLLHALRDALEGSSPDGEFNYCADLAVQLGGVAESLIAFANETNFVLQADRDTHAYWVGKVRPPKRPAYTRLVGAPLSVADDLKRIFYSNKDSVILCSATLRVGNDFRYMAKRLGAAERFNAVTASSPFDYLRQALVLAPDCLPDPSEKPADYAEALASLLNDVFNVTSGRALVLFTSYEMMNAVAAFARDSLERNGISMLVQGEGLSREKMTQALKERKRTVLFGAQSFWEGVDVAGEALSCVILARLPFAQVGEPVVEARSEKIDRDGGNSFRDYSLPEAVIRFRQGFGRLIRTKTDHGVVVVTDPRLVTKNYGAIFRKSIPASVHTVTTAEELLGRINDFMAWER